MAQPVFLTIPGEIRNKVYAYIFDRFELQITKEGLVYGPSHSSQPRQAICRTNKLIRLESIPILARQTRVLRSDGSSYPKAELCITCPGTPADQLKTCFRNAIRVCIVESHNCEAVKLTLPNLKLVLHQGSTVIREEPENFMEDDDEFIEEFGEKQEGTHDENTFEDSNAWYHTKPSNVELWLREEQKCYESVDQPRAEDLGPEVWEPYGGRGAVACEHDYSKRWERSEVRVRLSFESLNMLLTSHRVCGSTLIWKKSSMQSICHFRYGS